MRNHHEYPKRYIGTSDVASLITYSPLGEARTLHFGEDGSYYAYIVDKEAEIPRHYKYEYSASKYLRIYDDEGKSAEFYGNEIKIYRAKIHGCIIQIIEEEK